MDGEENAVFTMHLRLVEAVLSGPTTGSGGPDPAHSDDHPAVPVCTDCSDMPTPVWEHV